MSVDSLTLAQIRELRPEVASYLDFALVNSPEKFLKALYSDIDACIGLMEEDPSVRQNDSEDRLTEDFKVGLRMRGYNATHDEKIGGHSDLVVRHRNLPCIWLAEAKIHGSYDYLLKGFNQLSTRYSPGTPGNDQGGMIIYIRQKNAADILQKWKSHLEKSGLYDLTYEDCKQRPKLAFYTTHTHESSGLPYRVRHLAVVLHFDPKDR